MPSVSEQRLQQAVVQRVAGPMRDEPAHRRGPGQRQVAHRIQQLVADELVGHAQAGEVQHPRLIDHHRVLQTAALGQAGGAELVDLLGEREGAGTRQLMAERRPASDAARAPAGRSPTAGKSIDIAMSRPAIAGNRRPQLGECLAVAHPDRAADLDRRPRRCPAQRRRHNPAGTRTARRSRRGSAAPVHRSRPRHCRCRSRQVPPSHVRWCRSGHRRCRSPWRAGCQLRDRSAPGCPRRGRRGGTRCHDQPEPAGTSGSHGVRDAAHADTADRCLERLLAPRGHVENRADPANRPWAGLDRSVYTGRLVLLPFAGLRQSMIVSECFRYNALILRIFPLT